MLLNEAWMETIAFVLVSEPAQYTLLTAMQYDVLLLYSDSSPHLSFIPTEGE